MYFNSEKECDIVEVSKWMDLQQIKNIFIIDN